jgi:hypothetical protein
MYYFSQSPLIFFFVDNQGIFSEILFCLNGKYRLIKKDRLRMNWSNNLSKKLRNSYNAMKRLLQEINI